jgi:two-component system response regulator FlrC
MRRRWLTPGLRRAVCARRAGGGVRCDRPHPWRERGRQGGAGTLHPRPLAASERPFVAINCATIPDNLLESTLFGHEGAFTGATAAHAGKFEQAQGGTLLLDEVSELPLPLQAKLLRALQEREVERVGGSRPVAVDIRVIATSNRDMAAQVAAGGFREDLFYPAQRVPAGGPALRERPQDVLVLAGELLRRHDPRAALAPCAQAALLAHPWPGNVRELANVMQRAAILAPGLEVRAEHLMLPVPRALAGGSPAPAAGAGAPVAGGPAPRRPSQPRAAGRARGAGGDRRQPQAGGRAPRHAGAHLRHKLARWREEGLVGDDV